MLPPPGLYILLLVSTVVGQLERSLERRLVRLSGYLRRSPPGCQINVSTGLFGTDAYLFRSSCIQTNRHHRNLFRSSAPTHIIQNPCITNPDHISRASLSHLSNFFTARCITLATLIHLPRPFPAVAIEASASEARHSFANAV